MSGISNELSNFELGLPDFSLAELPLIIASQPSGIESVESDSKRSPSLIPVVEPMQLHVPLSNASPLFLRRWLGTTFPSWLISTFVHVAVILTLAAWNIEPIKNELRMMLVSSQSTSDAEELEEFSIEQAMTSEQVSNESEESPPESPAVEPTIHNSVMDVSYSDVLIANALPITIPIFGTRLCVMLGMLMGGMFVITMSE